MMCVYANRAGDARNMAAYLALRSFVEHGKLLTSDVQSDMPRSGCYGAQADAEVAGVIKIVMGGG